LRNEKATIVFINQSLLTISILISGCPPQNPPQEFPQVCNSSCDIENSLSTNVSCGIFCKEGELDNPGTIAVTCVYRCPVKNSSVNGSLTSKHLLGKAFDFDQLSSEANWDVANTAYTLNPNWKIYLYVNGERTPFDPDIIPRIPESGKVYEHGHVGI